jgi:[acyl-carrier-protein] S-malonyltransferase
VAALGGAPLAAAGWTAGHSLGEFAALVGAGSLAAEDGLRLVALRGRLMDEVAGGRGGMLALIGPDAPEMAGEIGLETGTWVAGRNSPAQVVLSGGEDAIAAASRVARELGLTAIRLPVPCPFHSPLMAPARGPFEAALAAVEFRPPRVPVISAVIAAPFDDIPRRLGEAVTQPVRWREVIEWLAAHGARRFVEVGPGRTLTGLARRTLARAEVTA